VRPECNAKLGFASSQRLSETEAHDERLADDVAGMAEVTNSADEVRAHVSKMLDAYSGAMPLRGRPSRGCEAVN
jgi:hypothetical protein